MKTKIKFASRKGEFILQLANPVDEQFDLKEISGVEINYKEV
jgi:hypothetical protein